MIDDGVLPIFQRESMLCAAGIYETATNNTGIIDAKQHGAKHRARRVNGGVLAFAQHEPMTETRSIVVTSGDVPPGIDAPGLRINRAREVNGSHLTIEVRE